MARRDKLESAMRSTMPIRATDRARVSSGRRVNRRSSSAQTTAVDSETDDSRRQSVAPTSAALERPGRPLPNARVSKESPRDPSRDAQPVARRLPGLTDSVPYLIVGSVVLAYGLWLAVFHSTASIGRFSLEVPVLGVGGILVVGGLLGAFLEDEPDSPAKAREQEPDRLVVPAQEWLAMKAELAALKREGRGQSVTIETAPWDEGPSDSVESDVPPRPISTLVPSIQDAIQELETIEQEIASRRSQTPAAQQ